METYWCQYAIDGTEIKARWRLPMPRAETNAVMEMLDTCRDEVHVVELRNPSAVEETPETAVYDSCEETAEAREPQVPGSRGDGRGVPKEIVPSARDGDGDGNGVVCERRRRRCSM